MDLTVRGKVFKIDFVSNYVHEKYQELIELTNTIVDIVNGKEIKAVDTKEKKKEIEKKAKDIHDKIVIIRREMIKEIIETNYPDNPSAYNADWWQKKTDPDDINDFLLSCMLKDKITSKGVKKN